MVLTIVIIVMTFSVHHEVSDQQKLDCLLNNCPAWQPRGSKPLHHLPSAMIWVKAELPMYSGSHMFIK